MTIILEILTAVLALLLPQQTVEHLRATAPSYLTEGQAREHLAAATVAGMAEGESPAVLLAIAWHESRYTPGVVTVEPGNRVSCGVMTPEPLSHCEALSLLGQYRAGAAHLASWRRVVGSYALLGYAGLVGACQRGPYLRNDKDLCLFQSEMLRRAAWIAGANS